MHLFTPVLFPPVSLSVHPPFPPCALSLFKHLSTYHSFIHLLQQRGTEEHGHSAEWSKLGSAACTTGMEGMGEERDWAEEEREVNYRSMERGRGLCLPPHLYFIPSLPPRHWFRSLFHGIFSPQSGMFTHVSSLYLFHTLLLHLSNSLFH